MQDFLSCLCYAVDFHLSESVMSSWGSWQGRADMGLQYFS